MKSIGALRLEEVITQFQEVVVRLEGELVEWGAGEQSHEDAPQKSDFPLSHAVLSLEL
jgi:hypothetical protein